MKRGRWMCFAAALAAFSVVPHGARADGPAAYDAWTKDAQADRGLFTLWHKGGKLYVELAPAQLDHDFVQTIVPSTGVGGQGVVWGNTDHLPAELVRFEHTGDSIAILWPNPNFIAPHDAAARLGLEHNIPQSVVGLAPVVASDPSGKLIFDASLFLDDQLDFRDVLKSSISDTPNAAPYELDRDRSYFGKTRAFPRNVVIEALQTWGSGDQLLSGAVPDPRHVQFHVTYNIAEMPVSDDYRPRYSDDRVGIYDDVYLQFDNDEVVERQLRYAIRWNLAPSDPSKPLSPAKHPMVFTMSDTIPVKYRPAIKAAVLKWNAAFEKIGISDALQVVDQPDDPNFDPDDIRYNMLRWAPEYNGSFGADSQTLYDPRTGEEFRTGVLIDAAVPEGTYANWHYVVDPVRFGRSTDPMPAKFMYDSWLATILHETGHNLGMMHNFIGSRAYTAKQLQDPSFTAKHGIASTVMEYAPENVWPRGTGNGDVFQTTLGPYDYYAMQWAYGTIPGAKTPEDELPALQKLASKWSDPAYRYDTDEDVSWGNGHAADPRVEQGILTNDPLGWCRVQLSMDDGLMRNAGALFPQDGGAYEEERRAFAAAFGRYSRCAAMPARYIGGQYVSRAHRGDPHAEPPIVPVPRSEQRRAFDVLDRYMFGASAWNVPAKTLQQLGYSEWAGYGYGREAANYGGLPPWAYSPTERHDFNFAERLRAVQNGAMRQMFLPIVLSRLADGPSMSTERAPMQLADLFNWMHDSIYRELGGNSHTIAPMRRSLQADYTQILINLYVKPDAGVPSDARALARAALVRLNAEAGRGTFDAVSRAHLDTLRARAKDALEHGRAA